MTQAFISYAHDDHRAFEEFLACLKPVARAFGIDVWADRRLRAGHFWNDKIAAQIEASDIHILLMSVGFFGSDYIFDHELPVIAARRRIGALTVPVLIERCYWSAFVGGIQAAPMNGKGRLVAVKEWKPPRSGYSTACDQIATAITDQTPALREAGERLRPRVRRVASGFRAVVGKVAAGMSRRPPDGDRAAIGAPDRLRPGEGPSDDPRGPSAAARVGAMDRNLRVCKNESK